MNRSRIAILIAAFVVSAATSARAAAFYTESETFDLPGTGAIANGWTGFNNTAPPVNYGFRTSNNTLGDPAGEAGGTSARVGRSYYADTTLTPWQAAGSTTPGTAGVATLDDRLEWTGELVVTAVSANFAHSRLVGYIQKEKAVADVDQDILGFMVLDSTVANSFRVLSIGYASDGSLAVADAVTLSRNVAYTFETLYDPTIGDGKLTTTFRLLSDNSLADVSEMSLSSSFRSAGGIFNAFGMSGFNHSAQDATNTMDMFIDNLSYTTTPEPGGVTALLAGIALAAARRRRSGK